jgi:subtilisin family serine protease
VEPDAKIKHGSHATMGKPPAQTGAAKQGRRDVKSMKEEIMEPNPTLRQRGGTPTLEKRSISTQTNAPWGLAKLSYCTGNDNSQLYDLPTFKYDSSAGSGIRVYVVDSGILTGHSVFSVSDPLIWLC